jgi:hypothetical protein
LQGGQAGRPPLSPMLFLLAMEPFYKLFRKAQADVLLGRVSKGCENFRISLYADAAAIFINPHVLEWKVTSSILNIFVEASGLITNLDKIEFYPIRCDQSNLAFLSDNNMPTFPCIYLGLPVHYRKLPSSALHLVIQKIASSLPGWKRNFLTYPGRELLVKIVLTAMPTYFLTVFKIPKWGFAKIDKFRISFLWKGHEPDSVRPGRCLVNWQKCMRPKKLGGLGIKDLEKFNRALRLRCLWFNWDQKERP